MKRSSKSSRFQQKTAPALWYAAVPRPQGALVSDTRLMSGLWGFVLLICQVMSGLGPCTYLSPPQGLVLLLQPPLSSISLKGLSLQDAGPEHPGTVNSRLELDSFWQLSIASCWDPTCRTQPWAMLTPAWLCRKAPNSPILDPVQAAQLSGDSFQSLQHPSSLH